MKNPVQPDIEIALPDPQRGGAEIAFFLQFDFEAIARAEDITGLPLLTGLTVRELKYPRISFVRAMFFAALLRHEPKITYEEAASFVGRDTLPLIWGKLIKAWNLAAEEEDAAKPNPTTAQS